MERAGDEVRSWFGDEEAQRRRLADEREEPSRGRSDWGWRESRPRETGREPLDREWGRQFGYLEGRGPSAERWRDWSRPPTYGGTTGYGYSSYGRERDWEGEPTWGGQGPGGFGTYGREPDWSYRGGDWARYAGLSSQRNREPGTGPHYGRGPRGYQRADERIREDVCERFAMHSYLDPSDVEIHVQNGEVTLQGTVPDRWAKRTSEEIAEGVWGVKEVHNHLRVAQDRRRDDESRGSRGAWAA
jgi:hypothetical protein